MKNGGRCRLPFFAASIRRVRLEAVRVLLWAIVVIVVVVIVVAITMIAIAVMGMMHGYVISLYEALAIVLALSAVYGRMSKHTRIVRIHPTVVFEVEACCFDAVMEALAAGVAELRRRCVPLSGIALHSVVIVVSLLRAILLGMETDGRECSQCNCQKWCGETNGSH